MLTAAVMNASGRFKRWFSASEFLPNYLRERTTFNKSIEQQNREFMDFKMRLQELKAAVIGKTDAS